jgi:adenylate kinase
MLVALTGTPGTGKTTVSNLLRKEGYKIVKLKELAVEKDFVTGIDKGTKIVDIEALNNYVNQRYKGEDIVFIEGHLSHLLDAVDKVIVLRCHPTCLKRRLESKRWNQGKIKENVDAETLDVILCEAAEIHPERNIFEIDTTGKKTHETLMSIVEIVKNNFRPLKKYNIGKIDWSEEILKD